MTTTAMGTATGRGADAQRLNGLRIAIVHDYFTQWGGAERVALELHRMFPAAPIHTTLVDAAMLPEEMADADIRPSFLQRHYRPGRGLLPYLPFLPGAVRSLRIHGYDLVITSSSAFAHAAPAHGGTKVHYVYNTMRFAWDYQAYIREYPVSRLLKGAGYIPAAWLRSLDRRTARDLGKVIAISSEVKRRIRRNWGRSSDVVFPPADLGGYAPSHSPRTHLLVVSRLIPYKRIDLAVQAANASGARLVVVGDGPDRQRLEQMAGPRVEFLGWVDEATKHELMRTAVAVVVPGAEDYGLVPVEANAWGTPAVAFAAGGVLDTQRDGTTAVLVSQQSVEAFSRGYSSVYERTWDPENISRHAQQFGTDAFRKAFVSAVVREMDNPTRREASGE